MAFPAGNTYWAVKDLMASGMPEEQAVAMICTVESLWPKDVATKEDLKLLHKELEHYILKCVFGTAVIFTGLALALIEIWPKIG